MYCHSENPLERNIKKTIWTFYRAFIELAYWLQVFCLPVSPTRINPQKRSGCYLRTMFPKKAARLLISSLSIFVKLKGAGSWLTARRQFQSVVGAIMEAVWGTNAVRLYPGHRFWYWKEVNDRRPSWARRDEGLFEGSELPTIAANRLLSFKNQIQFVTQEVIFRSRTNPTPDLPLTSHQLIGRRVREYRVALRCKCNNVVSCVWLIPNHTVHRAPLYAMA